MRNSQFHAQLFYLAALIFVMTDSLLKTANKNLDPDNAVIMWTVALSGENRGNQLLFRTISHKTLPITGRHTNTYPVWLYCLKEKKCVDLLTFFFVCRIGLLKLLTCTLFTHSWIGKWILLLMNLSYSRHGNHTSHCSATVQHLLFIS
jgi:hypothetical protein